MNTKGIVIILFLGVHVTTSAFATSPAWELPYFHVPGNGSPYCLEVTPATDDAVALVRCVQFTIDDTKKQLWEVKGVYSLPGRIFLNGDGRSMARIRLPDKKMSADELPNWKLIEFFRDGKPMSSVRLGDVLDISRIEESSISTLEYDILNLGLDVENVQVFEGQSGFVRSLKLPSDKMLGQLDFLLVIHTSQWRSVFFRIADGKRVLERETPKQ